MKNLVANVLVSLIMIALASIIVAGLLHLLSDDTEYARLCAQQESGRTELKLRAELSEAKVEIAELEDKFEAMSSYVSNLRHVSETNIARLQTDCRSLNSRLAIIENPSIPKLPPPTVDANSVSDDVRVVNQ